MMTKELWPNLPVKDHKKAKAFFISLGLSFSDAQHTATMAAMMVGIKKSAGHAV